MQFIRKTFNKLVENIQKNVSALHISYFVTFLLKLFKVSFFVNFYQFFVRMIDFFQEDLKLLGYLLGAKLGGLLKET